ncbi:MAG: haloacid dehalogenase-like hydrolase [Planctomycetota bacterium]|jgi:hypothetical protein|nr:haloacid dehalogenase-like hydrolase [Planctomycetota bacterium]
MRIGLDFDNTLVRYDDLFHRTAMESGLIPPDVPSEKTAIRDWLREVGQEEEWILLQGEIYGSRIAEAPPFEGILDFVRACSETNCCAFIVSHKTRHPNLGPPVNLHRAARDWLASHGFFQAGIDPSNVHFETTRADKIERINSLSLAHFIDDLPEFLLEPTFPSDTQRILFDPGGRHPEHVAYCRAESWKDIQSTVFGGCP